MYSEGRWNLIRRIGAAGGGRSFFVAKGEEIMAAKIKAYFASDKGMRAVNLLFLLSMLIPGAGISFLACGAWILYLRYCLRRTGPGPVRAVYWLFIGFAVFLMGVNLYGLLRFG